ncbi:alpha/beta hydrolase [Streptomyces sp. NBC_01450]|uniref:alpha/beta hydrolase n=1 Tax=Streptomyces sp. NBC_01450 TaxID=2903871 RepID=UPI003FCD4C82
MSPKTHRPCLPGATTLGINGQNVLSIGVGMTGTPTGAAGPVVLIHGLWMTPRSWEKWAQRYQAQGHRVIAPAWPGLDGEVEEIRRDPARVAGVGLREVVARYEEVIRNLDEAPVIIGHSFGGAITQILLDRGLGRAGVAIDSAPVKGVLPLPFSTLKSAWPVLGNPANKNKAIALTPRQFHYGFTNTLGEEESAAAYERYQVPGSARALPGRLRQLQSPRRDENQLPQPATGAVAVHRRRGRPHRAAEGEQGQLAPVPQVPGRHRVPGVSRPLPLHHRPGRVGGSRRLRPQLGC